MVGNMGSAPILRRSRPDAHTSVIDIEPPNSGTRCASASEVSAAAAQIMAETAAPPWMYSNQANIATLGNPAWLNNFWWWIAQYPYKIWPLLYTDYDSFLARYPEPFPSSATKVGITRVAAWQFTKKGKAENYIASHYTQDPAYPIGMQECDLSVSCIPRVEFLAMFNAPEPPPMTELERIEYLESLHGIYRA